MMDLTDVHITRADIEKYFDNLEKKIKEREGFGTGKKIEYDYYILLTEYNDETGHYFTATSPDIDGLVTDGKTIQECQERAGEAIQALLEVENEYPKPSFQPFTDWNLLKDNQAITMASPVFLEPKPWKEDKLSDNIDWDEL